jgi:hypothetical protein
MVASYKKRDAMSKSSMHMMTKNNIGLVFFCFLFCAGHRVMAYPSLVGVRGQSLGDAYRAVASANDILLYNPAGLIANRHLGADADYLLASDAALHSLTVSVVDSQTTSWGLGLAYSAGITAKSDIATTHLAYLGMAMPLGTDQIALGGGFSYLYDPLDPESSYRHFFNIDVGLLADLGAGLRFAVVVDHLLSAKGREKPFGLSIGSAFALSDLVEAIPLTASFDWSMADVKNDFDLGHVLGLGFEYLAYSVVPLRIGYRSAVKENSHHLSMGTGVKVKGFALDALYQQQLTIGKIRHFGVAVRIDI